MLGSRYVIRTPMGQFRARVARFRDPAGALDADAARRVWSFFDYEIETLDRDAVAAALELHQEVSFGRVRLQGDHREPHRLEEVRREFERAVRFGAVVFEPVERLVAHVRRERVEPAPAPPPAPPRAARAEPETTPVHFELTFVDEFGAPIPGLAAEVLFRHDGARELIAVDGNGTARLDEPTGGSFAWARLADAAAVDALRDALAPLWAQAPRVQDRREQVIAKEDAETSIVHFRSPPLARDGEAPQQSPLLTRDFKLVTDEPHRVSVQPHVELARLIGFYFDTNKCFLLPSAVPSLRSIVELHERNRGAAVLIVGHTDTSGEPAYNERLSLERAEAMAAYLQDRVDDWMAWYGWDQPDEKRWGAHEDSLMIESLAGRGLEAGPSPTLSYQQWHNALAGAARAANWEHLNEDGKIGPKTRAQLVGDYMNHDGTTLAPEVEVATHGCGECFPLDETGENPDADAQNGERDQMDRRVEVFFFDRSLGAQPPPPAKTSKRGSPEYPEWRARARVVAEAIEAAGGIYRLRLHDDESRLMPNATCRIWVGTSSYLRTSDSAGWVELDLGAVCPATVVVEWGEDDSSPPEYRYSQSIELECSEGDAEVVARARLQNIGYLPALCLDTAVRKFQHDYDLELSGAEGGAVPEPVRAELDRIWNDRDCDATPP
ncbi:MAG: OmpA family protein [Polyangiaceae bacterium]|nr:OmpA family protein [Polyangiaceae bacterium]